jgi:multiple sugar transport system permease protein
MTRYERHKLLWGLFFISPWILGFLGLTLYPIGASLYYSCCDYDILSQPAWIGTLNYRDMLTDGVFWQSLYNTLVYAAFALPLGLVTSLLCAVLLNTRVKGKSLFRMLFFLPSLVPLVATAMIWLWIFNGKYGLLNYVLSLIGLEGPNWLGDPNWTKPSLVLTSIWGIGNTIVIYLAALQEVPTQLYEAAEIDGASFCNRLRHITIPMISPVIYFNLIMGIIGSLQVFAQPYIMFGGGSGGPNRSALFYAVYLYENAFTYNQMGYACAMAWVLFLIILGLTWLATRATRKHIHYGN